jgi:amino acid adenylation domain-containing protein
MSRWQALHHVFSGAAEIYPEHAAVEEPGRGAITYGQLDMLSDGVRDRLAYLGVRPGDRVGIYMRKSIDAVATILGILKAGAAYTPVDPTAPPSRNAFIFDNCAVRAVIVEDRFKGKLAEEFSRLGGMPAFLVVSDAGGGTGIKEALNREELQGPAPAVATHDSSPGDLAYILYTSGSTGKPKGVMLSHDNAVSFVDWCSETFQPQNNDRFSSHAPFHFDLSILDIYVPLKHGATLVLVTDDIGKDPPRLAQLIAEQRISVWYSAPSILSLLAQFGNLHQHDYRALRLVLFAGEVFPVKHLRALKELWPHPRYFNLYGPTETNVCTFYEIPAVVPDDRSSPFPIGVTCSHLQSQVVDEQGRKVPAGREGELCISGRGVMQGYWNLPEQDGRAFLVDDAGIRWYKTGDIVVEASDGNYTYVGRRDRMIKRRGYRIELGEIEAALYRHPAVKEAAVVAILDASSETKIKAFLSSSDGKRPSVIEMKRFCAEHLPLYMIPDVFDWQEALPKTSTDKIDYQRLKELA